MTDRIKNIAEMEQRLNESQAAADALIAAIEKFRSLDSDMEKLFSYYGSPEWFADRDADAKGELSGDLPRGVLTEDAVYDLIGDCERIWRMMDEFLTEKQKAQ